MTKAREIWVKNQFGAGGLYTIETLPFDDGTMISPTAIPVLGCDGFMGPSDRAFSRKKKVKGAIPPI